MKHEIIILFPGRKCSKCRRMIAKVKGALNVAGFYI
jgi:hypothetical protein